MPVTVEAIYKGGSLRLLEPLDLEEDEQVSVTVEKAADSRADAPRIPVSNAQRAAEYLQQIAALPREPRNQPETGGIDHDHYLYGAPKQSERLPS